MKRKYLNIVILLVLTGVFTMQSCKKEDSGTFKEFHAFSDPTASAPKDGATIKITGSTVDLTWASSSTDGGAVTADVYFGTSATPPLFKAGNTGLKLTVPVTLGLTYYWSVTMIDANGVMTPSPTWSFTVFEPIGIFVGTFKCDEPAEAYSYDVTFTKTNDNTLTTKNYWNSGWTGVFAMNFVANTYSMPLSSWGGGWTGQESGTIDPATGKMVGNYTIWLNNVVNETGVHTYTKK